MNIRVDKEGKRLSEISKDDVLTFVEDSGLMVSENVVDVNYRFNEVYTEHISIRTEKDYSSFTVEKEEKIYELNPLGIITNKSKGRVFELRKVSKDERRDAERQVREMAWQDADWM
jgi:hypothetical protein